MLTRNLDRRVEILLLINDKESMSKLKDIIKVFQKDEKNSFQLNDDGNYKHLKGDFDCHQWFIDVAENKVKLKIAKKK
jgi:polyphosphate kinase